MSRPLLNLSIVELTQMFEDSEGSAATSLDLIKELRHRSTPKANALAKRVMAVIAQLASAQQLQALHIQELEILAKDSQRIPGLNARLIQVLETRSSSKAFKLLNFLESKSTVEASPSPRVHLIETSLPHSDQPVQYPSLLLAKNEIPTPIESASSIPIRETSDVDNALALLGLSVGATWREVEMARQSSVQRYRPAVFADRDVAKIELSKITEAYQLLAKCMGHAF